MRSFTERSSKIGNERNKVTEMLVLKKAKPKDVRNYYGLLRYEFRKPELVPHLNIQSAVRRDEMELLLISDDRVNVVVAYAFVSHRGMYGYPLINYFCVMPWYREGGYRENSLHLIIDRYRDKQGLLIELPEYEGGEVNFDSTKEFYENFGFEEIPCRYYKNGVKTHILNCPLKSRKSAEGIIGRIIPEIYERSIGSAVLLRNIRIERAVNISAGQEN